MKVRSYVASNFPAIPHSPEAQSKLDSKGCRRAWHCRVTKKFIRVNDRVVETSVQLIFRLMHLFNGIIKMKIMMSG